MCQVNSNHGGHSRLHGGAVIALLTIHVVLLGWSGYCHSPAFDEVGHLPAGISSWHYARFDIYSVNPPLVRWVAALPVVIAQPRTAWSTVGVMERPEWSLGAQFVEANGDRAFRYFTWARWACIPFSLLGAWVCHQWARALYGAASGVTALALWCFSPNILANASMITPDAGAAATGIAAHYAFWRWLTGPTWGRTLGAGLLLGLAELTKSTWIILFILWPAFALVWHAGSMSQWRRSWGQCTLMGLIGLYVINAGYGFEGSFRRLGDFQFQSRLLTQKPTGGGPRHNRFSGTALASLPVPLPANYVSGIDVQKSDFENRKWSFMNGEHRFGGWWHFYIYALALKVPLGTWLVAAMALYLTARHTRTFSAGWRNELALLVPAIAVLVLVSSQTGFSRYLRYALPLFPFVFIWVSKVARAISLGMIRRASLTVAAVTCSCISSLAVYPHSFSYFNEALGGPRHGHKYLIDASIDWGQDVFYLRNWLAAHPAAPLFAQCQGALELHLFGIPCKSVPDPFRPGLYAISVHCLHDRDGRYQWFLENPPLATAGYSIYVYHLSAEDAAAAELRARAPLANPGRRVRRNSAAAKVLVTSPAQRVTAAMTQSGVRPTDSVMTASTPEN